ncbi:MAG: DJ-1/PfpI family protein [Solirubrobacterales bacterium]
MRIAILIFDRLTALDAIGPYEVLSRLPGAELSFVATEPGPRRTDTGALGLLADLTLDELPDPDLLLVPGGAGSDAQMDDPEVLDWLRRADGASTWTTSVCTGSLVLGAAGILRGRRATTHWAHLERLRDAGAEPVAERVVEDGKLVTAAGVSAGIDMALTLAARIAGQHVAEAIQLGIEYDPQPPFKAGSPETAPAHIVEGLRARMRARMERDEAAALSRSGSA